MKITNSQGSLWCCRLLLLGRWNLANDRAARYVMQAWGRVCDGVDIGDNLGACSTKEWMDAVVSAKSLRVYSRRFARWYDRYWYIYIYRQHWSKIRGFSPWPFCSSWNNSPRHSKGASLPIPAVKTAGTYRKDDDPWRIWTWLWQDIPVSAYSRHALKMDSFSWHPMFCKKLQLSLGWRNGCSEWNLSKTPNFQIGEFIIVHCHFLKQIPPQSESMCQRRGMKISLHVSNTSAEAEGLCAYRLLRFAGRSVSTGSDFGWTAKNGGKCMHMSHMSHVFKRTVCNFWSFTAVICWMPRCVGTGNPVDTICRSFLRPLARNTVHNLQDPWLFQMEAFWKGQKTDRGYKEFVEKQYSSHGGFWQLRILIFSMVGVAAAIAEMLVNSKDHRMYHKLSFLLRIGVWTPTLCAPLRMFCSIRACCHISCADQFLVVSYSSPFGASWWFDEFPNILSFKSVLMWSYAARV